MLGTFLKKAFSSLKTAKGVLTHQQQVNWNKNGYLVLPGFFDASKIDQYMCDLDQLWSERSLTAGDVTIDLLEGVHQGKRLKLRDAPDEALHQRHKLNDLFLDMESCRCLNVDDSLSQILRDLLDGEPLVINSLSFTRGSEQPYHFDSYYMPPPQPDKMVVTSICLEDQSENAGPLSYFPGSHKIEPWIFDHGGINAIESDISEATNYIEHELAVNKLKPEMFVGKKGDVFIWHAQLYHGGLPIKDPSLTRRTLVTHYWRSQDLEAQFVKKYSEFASTMNRAHPEV
tara:strand:- start:17645 stop:18502 length:858 start_codon:yes stop_codon:yes gene_type:complete